MARARPAARILLVLALAAVCSAHVGSPDAWFEGSAGPYPILVHVEAPGVIPGIAVVNVRADTPETLRVTAFANRFDATGGTPPPDVAEPVDGQPGWYRARLWIMTRGSYGVTVGVNGARGPGEVVVPLAAIPTRRLGFGSGLALGLGTAGLILVAGLVTIVGSAVREGVLPPGENPDERRRRRARRAMVGGAAVIAVVLSGAWQWWGAEEAAFERSLFRPLGSTVDLRGSELALTIVDSFYVRQQRDDSAWSATVVRPSRLTTDHGKIMHLIVVDETGGRALAHLHPTTSDSITFRATVPALPPGRYHVFGDIVEESGFTQTLVGSVELPGGPLASTTVTDSKSSLSPEGATSPMLDPDDAWSVRTVSPAADAVALEDGSTLRWLRGADPIRVGEEAPLRFVVEHAGDGLPLEPYMGMAGHAVVVGDGGRVFVHLHPAGTISMAAQERLSGSHAMTGMDARPLSASVVGDTLTFPYAFPSPGRYHVWVQVKRGGRVLTGAVDADVQAAPGGGH